MATEPQVTIAHSDHGLLAGHIGVVHNAVLHRLRNLAESEDPDGFFIIETHLPDDVAPLPNAMYGPASGDEPVAEKDVVYLRRGDRPWADRMVERPTRPTRRLVIIGAGHTVFTAYGGPLAPQHPDDPDCADPEASQRFWSQHALATGSETPIEVAACLAHHRCVQIQEMLSNDWIAKRLDWLLEAYSEHGIDDDELLDALEVVSDGLKRLGVLTHG